MLSRLFNSSRPTRSQKSLRRTCKFEALENRVLMAPVTASLSNGLLDIRGTAGNDTIIVRQIGNTISIDGVRIQGSGRIDKIQIQGFGGHDHIRMDGNGVANQAVRVPGLIFGGDGDDTLIGGMGNDELQGGNHNDTLFGMGGNDLLFGQAGSDLMYGGADNDELQGGAGNDELLGETGHDRLFGDGDNDWLEGGAGDDYLDGGAGHDVAYGNSGRDSFRNLNDTAFFLTHPHIRSPRRGVGDLGNYGVKDFRSVEGDRYV